MFVSPFG